MGWSTNERIIVFFISIWALALAIATFTHETNKRSEIQTEMWFKPLERK